MTPATTPPALAPPAPSPPVARVAPAPQGPPLDEGRESSGWAGTAVRGASTLPAPLTSFIGRASELAAAQRALAGTRLLTLSGPGGIGKTRLALQVAAAVLPGYGDGVWLVDLAPVADDAGVAQAIAGVLGVREEPDRPLLETLAGALRPTRLLLVLDDCERVVGGSAAAVEALLRAAPRLQVLATSRQALGVTGETVWRVPPLRLPPRGPPEPRGGDAPAGPGQPAGGPPEGDDRGDRPEGLLRYDAVRLFLERAQASRGAFRLTRQNAPAVVAVCRRLDGLPLALELAAARVRVLSVEQLAARLDDRFRLLTRGSRTAPPRQQTLRATVAWSYDLLAAPERRLFERLAVFAGGWTLEAAERVCADEAPAGPAAPGPPAEGLDPADVLDLLSQLVDKSLVVVEDEDGGGEVRYRLLETLRQYAGERLAASGEDGAVRRRHAACYLALAEAAEPQLTRAEQGAWLARLAQEHDNLRAALRWLAASADAEQEVRLAGALCRFWDVRGHLSEGRRWLDGALARPEGAAPPVRAKALHGAGNLARGQGDYARAAALHEQSLALYRQVGDQVGVAGSLHDLGNVAQEQGDYARAAALHEQSLALRRALGDQRGTAGSLHDLGTQAREQGDYARAAALHEQSLALRRALGDQRGTAASLHGLGDVAREQGDYARAAALLQESLALYRQVGDQMGTAGSLDSLGDVAHDQGDYARAAVLLQESLALYRALGDQRGTAASLHSLGDVAREQGDYARAAALLQESLALRRQAGHKRGIARCLEGLAGVGGARGQAGRAARLYGAAAALREAIGVPLPPADRAVHDRGLAAARAGLGEAAFAIAWAAGQALPLEQAVADALEPADAPPAPGPDDGVHAPARPDSGEPASPAGPRR